MLRFLSIVLLVSLCGFSSAQKFSERNRFNDLEGSGFHGINTFSPDEQEDGSGFASGDDGDMDGHEKPFDDEDDLDNRIDESDIADNVENPIEQNEVHLVKNAPSQNDIDNRVAMASTNNNGSVFESTEMLAAMIAGGTIGLLFAILLILLLVYRMRKKDEGSYDLSKKPIYKKAPTTEFYA